MIRKLGKKGPLPQERKFSPKRKFLAGYPCGHLAKNFGQDLQIMEKEAFWHRHPARTSTKKLWSEKLRADFSFPAPPGHRAITSQIVMFPGLVAGFVSRSIQDISAGSVHHVMQSVLWQNCLEKPETITSHGVLSLLKQALVLQPPWPLTGVIRALRARNPQKVEKKKKVPRPSRPRSHHVMDACCRFCFLPILGRFNCFGVLGALGGTTDHNPSFLFGRLALSSRRFCCLLRSGLRQCLLVGD